MNLVAAGLFSGIILLAGSVQAQPLVERKVHFGCQVAQMPHWVSRPSGSDIAHLYPHGGATRENGEATLSCTIGVEGDMQDCRITSETPAGRGFAEATLKLAPKFRVSPPRCKDGSPALGGTLEIPVRWRIG